MECPTSIEFAQLNSTENVLAWKWKPPQGKDISELSYIVEYKTDKDGVILRQTYTENIVKLSNLKSNTEYVVSVKVNGTFDDESQSPFESLPIITTMETLAKGLSSQSRYNNNHNNKY